MDNLIIGLMYVIMSFGLPATCMEDTPEVCPVPKFKFFSPEEANGNDGKYNPKKWGENTIMLNYRLVKGKDAGKALEEDLYLQSVILHEYVHILQYKTGKFKDLKRINPCERAELETQAYLKQNQYLNRHGQELKDFNQVLADAQLPCLIWTHEKQKK